MSNQQLGFKPNAFSSKCPFFWFEYQKSIGKSLKYFMLVGLLYYITFSCAHGVNTRKIRQVAQERHVPTQKTPFLTKKLKDRRGKFQKDNSKGFSGGASGRVRPLALGLSLRSSAFTLEIGSSFGVNCHHFGTKTETVALSGGFF